MAVAVRGERTSPTVDKIATGPFGVLAVASVMASWIGRFMNVLPSWRT